MTKSPYSLGIDLGSISLKLALLDVRGNTCFTRWVRVSGEPLEVLAQELAACAEQYPHATISSVGLTGSGRELIASALEAVTVNEISAHAQAVNRLYPAIRTVIEIGGQDSKLIVFESDANGQPRITHFAMNELCAAGTGAFLDQQATRLGLSIEDFSALALTSTDPAPIAGRCAVFAKSDMTHHQQAGRSRADIVAGLHEALARSYLGNLVRGRELPRPIAFQGGVAANKALHRSLTKLLDLHANELVIPEHHRTMGAIGAALLARERASAMAMRVDELLARVLACKVRVQDHEMRTEPVLVPEVQSHLEPTFAHFPDGKRFLGIDIGSVSVKVAAVSRDGVAYSDYRFSEGRPLHALREILADLASHNLTPFEGVGVTGSGRHFVGTLVGADVVINEITAQAFAAHELHPDADTIVEIGGQDAKFLRLRNGSPIHFEMNRVCAAGTGAFLQEQAARLGVELTREFAEQAFASRSPASLGMRCTVFMESDLVSHQQQGFAKCDLVAGLAHSVIANYCEKVMAGAGVGERVLFLGGVAENPAVVAALAQRLGKTVLTSTVGKLTGAIGAAVAARNAWQRGDFTTSRFHADPKAIETKAVTCEACENRCVLQRTIATPVRTFGGRCGKWDEYKSRKQVREDSPLAARQALIFERAAKPVSSKRKIGIPRALFAFDQLPAWRTFFETLGFEVILSPETNDALLAEGFKHLVVETCLPVKTFCAHVHWLSKQDLEAIFVPSIVSVHNDVHGKETLHCPYIQALAAMAAPIARVRVVGPTINWRLDPNAAEREMVEVGKALGIEPREAHAAWRKAAGQLHEVRSQLRAIGDRVLRQLREGKLARAVVLLGKDYNVNDARLSSGIAKSIEAMGEVVLTQDMLADDTGTYSEAYRTMYWSHSKEMLAAATMIAETPGLVPVMITSFGCGPDSFTIRFLRDILGEKPLLTLEVDEHSSSVGMQTRIEAFFDALPKAPKVRVAEQRKGFSPLPIRRVFLPHFSAHGMAFTATLAAVGFEAILTDLPDDESARLGMQHSGSGECHPYALMLGDYIKVASRDEDFSDACYFMPESGACRVGQFGGQMRLVAEELGLTLPIYTRIEELIAGREDNTIVAGIRAMSTYWEMMRGMDFFMQAHLTARAYERVPGDADRAKLQAEQTLLEHIRAGNPRAGLAAAQAIIAAVPVDRSKPRVRIGITGDYYTRVCEYASGGLFRDIERFGGEVWLPPTMSEFVKYDAHQRVGAALRHKDATTFVKAATLRMLLGPRERRVRNIFTDLLEYDIPLEYERASELTKPYIDMRLPAGLTGSVAAVLEQINAGADGIVSAITFHCTYGLVLGSVLSMIDRDYPKIPKLTLIYEGLKPTHNRLRLEAFMEQVHAMKERAT